MKIYSQYGNPWFVVYMEHFLSAALDLPIKQLWMQFSE